MSYQAITTIKTQYGFDFLDKTGQIVATFIRYSTDEIMALYDYYDADESLWPTEALAISEVWERTETVTTFKRIPQDIRRNPANGRFMRTSYRESL